MFECLVSLGRMAGIDERTAYWSVDGHTLPHPCSFGEAFTMWLAVLEANGDGDMWRKSFGLTSQLRLAYLFLYGSR
jgi:hypothetical protein